MSGITTHNIIQIDASELVFCNPTIQPCLDSNSNAKAWTPETRPGDQTTLFNHFLPPPPGLVFVLASMN